MALHALPQRARTRIARAVHAPRRRRNGASRA
jgi:hypothetical protein